MTEAPPKEDLVTVTIDGIEASVPKGTLLIRVAEQLGISIPRFCDHPLLDPAGACRQCLVEVTDMGNGRGMPKPAASCTTTVMPGMVVKTQLTSVVADKAQQGVMELLLINHPLDCPICDKGGECPLQNQAMSNGRADSRFHEAKRTFPKPLAISSNVLLDRERCVLCQRCTRFSLQIAGDPFIDLLERGANQQIGTSEEQPFQSYFSGNTVQICPVGALTGASYRFRARPFDLMSTESICEHCSSGCAQRTDWRRSKVTRRLAGNDPEVNEEWNCDKGRWAFHAATQPDRVLTPLVRNTDGRLVEASWPEALERAARGLAEAVDRGGVGVLPGGRLTEEDAYAYAKFARVALGTNDIDARTRPVSAEELDFLASSVAGVGPAHVAYADLEKAPAVLLAGFEPEEESPIVFLRLRKATRVGKTQVFSVAARASRGLDKLDGTLVPALPGGEGETLDQLPGAVVAALYGEGSLILVGERLATSPGALSAAAALAAETGAKLAWIPRRAGERGAVDAGALPTLLPGGRPVADATARAEVEALWGAVPDRPGRDIDGILQAVVDGSLAALVVGGVDPDDTTDPALAHRALERAGFVVSLELRHSAVTEHADVVLPVAPQAEKSGRYVTWEGRRRPFELTIAGTGAISDGRVLNALADELDADLALASVDAARAELLALAATTSRAAVPTVHGKAPAAPGDGQALLATWAELIDAGRMQDGDRFLAGTAKPVRAYLGPQTAQRLGVVEGDEVAVSTERGAIVAPASITAMADGVVWLPTNAHGCAVRSTLGATAGSTVRVVRQSSPPVVGVGAGSEETA
ncbi:NADH-quinone oxidoreductase subunit G [Jatrophihabitans endophyticus]|uniref:NADH-quinone oxidoreductase subunit G n=1 Tax=Jatrophihabitans endophyticus TaxID=1206085 RepID=UPI001A0807C7|nr:NADH-quinone oxidoreductase subunit G [Jatrophihabitans endophyticus]MBE7188132.1 NADH-quinone oxidoreductase subunit G [Jatrophihabitans endophyticus]